MDDQIKRHPLDVRNAELVAALKDARAALQRFTAGAVNQTSVWLFTPGLGSRDMYRWAGGPAPWRIADAAIGEITRVLGDSSLVAGAESSRPLPPQFVLDEIRSLCERVKALEQNSLPRSR